MRRLQWAILAGLMAALAGVATALTIYGERPAALDQRLEGVWEVTAVERDGVPDARQIGARMTFAGGAVSFEPNKVPEIVELPEPLG